MEKEVNLKHGLKVSKRDVALETAWFVMYLNDRVSPIFKTKLDALNHLSLILVDEKYHKQDFSLIKLQTIKF